MSNDPRLRAALHRLDDLQREITLDSRHIYHVEGCDESPPSVSSLKSLLSSPGLEHWRLKIAAEYAARTGDPRAAAREPNRLGSEAAHHGTLAHAAVQAFLTCQPLPTLTPEARAMFTNWLVWWDTAGIEPLRVEQRVHSSLGYCGTLDALGVDRAGNPVLLDWKSNASAAPYFELLIQAAAYRGALREIGFPEPIGALFVQLKGDDVTVHDLGTDFELAHAALRGLLAIHAAQLDHARRYAPRAPWDGV